jgi:hypothetical protein
VQEVNPAWVAAVGSLSAVIVGILVWAGRTSWRVFQRLSAFLEDWNGVEGDGGHPHRPGVMERMVRLETTMSDVQSQVHLNSGHSLRDEVQRTEAAVAQVQSDLGKVKDQVTDLAASVDELKAR